jgi:multidrug resistance efflux pump
MAPESMDENSTRKPKHSTYWFRFSKLGLALAFLAATAYFFHEQVWTSTSLEGTVTSPLITIRSPIDGIVAANSTKIGTQVNQRDPLFVIEAHQLDTQLRAELEAKFATSQQQSLVIDQKIAEFSMLRNQLQERSRVHREATLARLEALIGETTAELSRAKAVLERTQHELSRAKTLSANGLIAQTTLDDAVLAGQQSRFEVERLTASVKRLTVERTAAKNGILLGEGYSDAPYSQQRIHEMSVRLTEANAEHESLHHTQQELAGRLGEEQRRENNIRLYAVNAPIDGMVWNLHIASGGVVARNTPLADMVDCQRGSVEAIVPERRYDDVQIGQKVHVKLLGNSRAIAGTIHAVRGQSAVVNRESLAAWLTPRRTTEAMTVSIEIDPDALQQVSKGVCQIGRSAKVYFPEQDGSGFVGQTLASLTGFVSSGFAAIVPPTRHEINISLQSFQQALTGHTVHLREVLTRAPRAASLQEINQNQPEQTKTPRSVASSPETAEAAHVDVLLPTKPPQHFMRPHHFW